MQRGEYLWPLMFRLKREQELQSKRQSAPPTLQVRLTVKQAKANQCGQQQRDMPRVQGTAAATPTHLATRRYCYKRIRAQINPDISAIFILAQPAASSHPKRYQSHTSYQQHERVLFENRPALYFCNYKENDKNNTRILDTLFIDDFIDIMEQDFHL